MPSTDLQSRSSQSSHWTSPNISWRVLSTDSQGTAKKPCKCNRAFKYFWTGSAGKHQSWVSEQAPTPLPRTVVKNGEDNPQTDALGQLFLSNRLYYQSRCSDVYFANRRNLRQLYLTALLPELPSLSWTIPNPLQPKSTTLMEAI